ncbi:hypothetical protein LZ32DRAFT_623231 [Colletotrichum eremochloae]|nr:hypothetical protein LZ32DRAFT_623231 [Colletotrichum eremochloae]
MGLPVGGNAFVKLKGLPIVDLYSWLLSASNGRPRLSVSGSRVEDVWEASTRQYIDSRESTKLFHPLLVHASRGAVCLLAPGYTVAGFCGFKLVRYLLRYSSPTQRLGKSPSPATFATICCRRRIQPAVQLPTQPIVFMNPPMLTLALETNVRR